MSGRAAAAPREPTRVPAPVGLPRLLAGVRADGRPLALDEHVALWGRPPRVAQRLIELAAASGLRGRGGASFPTATKLEAVARRRGRAIVVANGAEGEPASAKDRLLLASTPHLVLDGVALAAAAVGAREAVVAVPASGRAEVKIVAAAVDERRRARLDASELRVVRVPDRFVSGEETALVDRLNGGEGKPTFVPPRPFERGVGGRPTLVQNVETLANLALLARFGPDWFRSVGTREEPGAALVTISGALAERGVYEIALGTPLSAIVAAAGGPTEELGAVLIGGYFGSWLTPAEATRVSLLDADLRAVGASVGAGALAALPASTCGVLETARVARYLAHESARQCGPCVHGLAAVAGALERLARREGSDLARVHRWLGEIEGRGACAHPDGAVRFVASALRVFSDEFERHAAGRCSGGGRPVLPLGRKG